MSNRKSYEFILLVITLFLQLRMASTVCVPCSADEYFSENEECIPCPQGLWCRGDSFVDSRIKNSTWVQKDGVYFLAMCPLGYHSSSQDPILDLMSTAKSQYCELCQQGHECTNPPCQACTPCKPGFYKGNLYTGSCLPCPADTYNQYEGGGSLESSCLKCPDQSSTKQKTGSASIHACECKVNLYPIISENSEKIELKCAVCPFGAICPDGTCALRSPGRYCNQAQNHLLEDMGEWDGAKWTDVSSRVQGFAPTSRQDAGFATIKGFLYMHGGLGSSGGPLPLRLLCVCYAAAACCDACTCSTGPGSDTTLT
jgi:hypothetical protein